LRKAEGVVKGAGLVAIDVNELQLPFQGGGRSLITLAKH
jgi:hypothetical protein